MELKIEVHCEECGKTNKVAKKIPKQGSVYLSDLIEESSHLHCNVNYSNGMVVNCECGNRVRIFI